MLREEEVENEIPKNNQNNTKRAKPSGENKKIEVCVEFGRAAFPFRSARQMVFPASKRAFIDHCTARRSRDKSIELKY